MNIGANKYMCCLAPHIGGLAKNGHYKQWVDMAGHKLVLSPDSLLEWMPPPKKKKTVYH